MGGGTPTTADRLKAALWTKKAYAAASLLPPGPPARLVVLTEGRAGSEALITRLGSHPAMLCDSEILHGPRRWPERLIEGRTRLARRRGRDAYGFKVLSRHLLANQPSLADGARFLSRLAADGWLVVHLQRGNRVHQAVSGIRAMTTQYHYEVGQPPPFTPIQIDPEYLTEVLAAYGEATAEAAAMLDGLDPVRLVYEDDLRDPADQARTVDGLLDRLGLTPAPTATRQVRVHPERLRDMVTNHEEIAAALQGGPYEDDLDDDPTEEQGATAGGIGGAEP